MTAGRLVHFFGFEASHTEGGITGGVTVDKGIPTLIESTEIEADDEDAEPDMVTSPPPAVVVVKPFFSINFNRLSILCCSDAIVALLCGLPFLPCACACVPVRCRLIVCGMTVFGFDVMT